MITALMSPNNSRHLGRSNKSTAAPSTRDALHYTKPPPTIGSNRAVNRATTDQTDHRHSAAAAAAAARTIPQLRYTPSTAQSRRAANNPGGAGRNVGGILAGQHRAGRGFRFSFAYP